ncbi:hypothetical protein GF385_04375 [Candidatus Dependentiae bacterium]|nr:hypothetical protein [Candidatus Dependentiae bacterium]
MKSLLQEESSVAKAIDKAWDISGKPYEFTVKVLSNEVRNFLGILKSPAVISFSYNPKFRTDKEKVDEIRKVKKDNIKKHQRSKKNEYSKKDRVDHEMWKKELVNDIKNWTKDILKIMGFKVDFTIDTENKMLNIHLNRRILRDNEDEKMFFISLSNVLMQFLKRKYKKKFSNYYLIIHSRKLKDDKGS